MSAVTVSDDQATSTKARVIQPAWVRALHWTNAFAMVLMIMSGWQIYNASPLFDFRFSSSITLGGWLGGLQPTGATVRFQRSVYDKGRGASQALDSKIATMEFTYSPDLRLNEEDRLLNPLGFRVTNYRVDDDFASAALPEREFPAPPSSADMAPAVPSAVASADGAVATAPGPAQVSSENDVSRAPLPAEQSESETGNGVPQR